MSEKPFDSVRMREKLTDPRAGMPPDVAEGIIFMRAAYAAQAAGVRNIHIDIEIPVERAPGYEGAVRVIGPLGAIRIIEIIYSRSPV